MGGWCPPIPYHMAGWFVWICYYSSYDKGKVGAKGDKGQREKRPVNQSTVNKRNAQAHPACCYGILFRKSVCFSRPSSLSVLVKGVKDSRESPGLLQRVCEVLHFPVTYLWVWVFFIYFNQRMYCNRLNSEADPVTQLSSVKPDVEKTEKMNSNFH